MKTAARRYVTHELWQNKDDVVVLAGKGHENYQEINGIKHPFDEKIIVAEILEDMRCGRK